MTGLECLNICVFCGGGEQGCRLIFVGGGLSHEIKMKRSRLVLRRGRMPADLLRSGSQPVKQLC